MKTKLNLSRKSFFLSLLLFFFVSCLITSAQTEKVKSADGVEIAYSVRGIGEPAIVFIHGWSCDKSYWNEQVRKFSEKYQVVAIDLAGHGESGLERKNYTLQAFGQDVAAVVNLLGLEKVILVGHSMGGPVVIEASSLLKGKVIGLIGADTFQNMGTEFPADQAEQFLKPFKENFVPTARAFVKQMFTKIADSLLVKKVADDMSAAPPQVAISAMENMFKDNGLNALKELAVPIITINCDMYPIQIEENKKLVKSFQVKMMPGSGHFVMLDNPQLFDKLLQEAIEELSK